MLQLLMVRSGIMESIVEDIISAHAQEDTSLQTSFDLLSEIVKYNKRTLLIVESSMSEEEFNAVCGKILKNIVDSNVLVRALILSLHRFEAVSLLPHIEC
eukprot:TRINITY_DN10813_c0_g1_i1.p4 TRINITY_DN10813_c0_g1~~TRINITY_DN10813_c0_g1_i1.p4  ORF type:complete len:100 (-),score=29.76 TRINITY_DN10813_c0_g1_i1:680-979(-)